jgi:hypothetical protein
MSIDVTMLQTRRGEGGVMWVAGSTYSASDQFGMELITANLATGVRPVVPPSNLTVAEVASTRSLVSEAGKQAAPKNNDPATVRAAVYPMAEGAGSTLTEQSGRGPSIAVGGTVTGAWANAGWFTHDAAGNTLKLASNAYIDGLIDISTECSILVGCDLWLTAWPSSTETLWALHRSDLTGGGVRMPLPSASSARFGVFYRASGASEVESIAITMPGGFAAIGNQRLSLLTELRVLPARNELHAFLYINGRMERGNVVALGTPPAANADGGLSFSGYGSASPIQKLGSGGSGARTELCFVARHSGRDRNIAGRLAAHIWANAALPSWLNRI